MYPPYSIPTTCTVSGHTLLTTKWQEKGDSCSQFYGPYQDSWILYIWWSVWVLHIDNSLLWLIASRRIGNVCLHLPSQLNFDCASSVMSFSWSSGWTKSRIFLPSSSSCGWANMTHSMLAWGLWLQIHVCKFGLPIFRTACRRPGAFVHGTALTLHNAVQVLHTEEVKVHSPNL